MTTATLLPLPEFVLGDLADRIEIDADGCWLWTGARISTGYGSYKNLLVHRLSFEAAVGPIGPGLIIDHECHNADRTCEGRDACKHRRCVNPTHLRAVTYGDNTRAGRGPDVQRARFAAITHCPQGHPYDEKNTYYRHDRPAGGRMCRACMNERSLRRSRERRKKAVA